MITKQGKKILSNKINHTLQPVFKSHKISEDLKMCEPKPPLIIANNALCMITNVICEMHSMSASLAHTYL